MAKFSFSKSYNKERVFNIDCSDFDYKSLEDLLKENGGDVDVVYPIRGIYINTKGLYEPAPVIATEDCYVNIPSHLVDTCRQILNDPRAIKSINDGEAGFKIYAYEQKRFNKQCYSIHFEDYSPSDID